MPLTYLIDEHLRGEFIYALRVAGINHGFVLDVCEIGDSDGPPLGTKDPALLLWCETHDRILISRDFKTLAPHLAAHIATDHAVPGIFLIRSNKAWGEVLDDLCFLAEASLPDEWRNRIVYIPL